MEQINYTKTTKKYQHLKYEQRLNLEFYLKNKKKLNLTIKSISELIGVSERTIYREIKRGMVYGIKNTDLTTKNEYSAQYSQNKYKENIKSKQGCLKIGNNINLSLFIEQEIIQKKNSPYVALENAKKENYDVNICLKTLYNYIDKEIFINLTKKNLPYNKKPKKEKIKEKTIRKIGGTSIEKREQKANDRLEIGHWEMDTVVGKRKGKSCCLLVLTERVSRKEIIRKIEQKKSKYVIQEIEKIKNYYKKTFNERFKSITSDNGSEFMDAKSIEEMGVKYYYAHSYCSGERGSNENNNKLIRRFIKKGEDISKITKKKIKEIEKWMNSYPRKMFGGKSADEIYLEYSIIPV